MVVGVGEVENGAVGVVVGEERAAEFVCVCVCVCVCSRRVGGGLAASVKRGWRFGEQRQASSLARNMRSLTSAPAPCMSRHCTLLRRAAADVEEEDDDEGECEHEEKAGEERDGVAVSEGESERWYWWEKYESLLRVGRAGESVRVGELGARSSATEGDE